MKKKLKCQNQETLKSEENAQIEECEICCQEIKIQGIISKCQHYFCIQCILSWTKVQKSCPKCRSKVSKIVKKWKRKTNNCSNKKTSKQTIYIQSSESDTSESDQDYIPINTFIGRYRPEDFI